MELRFSAQSVDAVQEVSVRDALIETLESRILGVINSVLSTPNHPPPTSVLTCVAFSPNSNPHTSLAERCCCRSGSVTHPNYVCKNSRQ